MVMVTPAGEAYDVKIDLAPLIAKFKQPNFSAEISPFVMKLTDQGGGKWLVTQDSPLSYSAKVPGQLDMTVKVGAMKGSAVFDQNVSAFTSSTYDIADLVVDETITTPEAMTMHLAYNIKAMHYETTSTPAGADALDSTFHAGHVGAHGNHQDSGDASWRAARWILPSRPRQAPRMEPSRALKPRAIYRLIAWFVAHPSEAAIKANQVELKSLVSAGLPLFENVTAKGALQNLSVTTPVGPVGIANLGFDVGVNGVVAMACCMKGFARTA